MIERGVELEVSQGEASNGFGELPNSNEESKKTDSNLAAGTVSSSLVNKLLQQHHNTMFSLGSSDDSPFT